MLSSLSLCAGNARSLPRKPVDNLGPSSVPSRFSTAFCLRAAATFGFVLLTGEAHAAEPDAPLPEPSRRGGFTFGVALGPQVGSTRGYPNDARKIGRAAYLSDTGFSGGGAGSAWIGITFNDLLSFSLAGYGGALVGAQHRSTYQAFAFRVEAFPAYRVGGPFRDVGVSVESGLGVVSSTRTEGDGAKAIDSGSASRFAFGAFYEGFRAWKLAMGPFVEGDLMWSGSAFRPTTWLGWRTNFTNKP